MLSRLAALRDRLAVEPGAARAIAETLLELPIGERGGFAREMAGDPRDEVREALFAAWADAVAPIAEDELDELLRGGLTDDARGVREAAAVLAARARRGDALAGELAINLGAPERGLREAALRALDTATDPLSRELVRSYRDEPEPGDDWHTRGVIEPAFLHAIEVCPRRASGQDRVAVLSAGDRAVIALADGAGGTSGGERAAEAVIEAVTRSPVEDWPMVLAELELDPDRLGPGQTTAVIVTVTRDGLTGASAGDSGAWVIRAAGIEDLTHAQHRKPLIGDHSLAVGFTAGPLAGGTLLVASDGLLRYAAPDAIARIAQGPDLAAAAHDLVALVRLPSGELPDDVAIVLCREV